MCRISSIYSLDSLQAVKSKNNFISFNSFSIFIPFSFFNNFHFISFRFSGLKAEKDGNFYVVLVLKYFWLMSNLDRTDNGTWLLLCWWLLWWRRRCYLVILKRWYCKASDYYAVSVPNFTEQLGKLAIILWRHYKRYRTQDLSILSHLAKHASFCYLTKMK